MNARKMSACLSFAAALTSVGPALAAPQTEVVDVVSILGGGSYVEIEASKAVCTENSITASWGRRPRLSYGDAPWGAQAVQSMATAALLSARKLTIRAESVGSGANARCEIVFVSLAK